MRPALPDDVYGAQTVDFQLLKIEQSNTLPPDSADADPSYKFNIQLFGVTAAGNSVFVCIEDFLPYFYIKVPRGARPTHLSTRALHAKLRSKLKFTSATNDVKSVAVVHRKSLDGFTDGAELPYYKVVCTSPYVASQAGNGLHSIAPRSLWPEIGEDVAFEAFETNVSATMRFTHQTHVCASGWVSVALRGRAPAPDGDAARTRCQVELHGVSYLDVQPRAAGGEGIAPLVLASFDIECCSPEQETFPNAENVSDGIIQIATTVQVFGGHSDPARWVRRVDVVGTCDPIDGVDVVSHTNEQDLLRGWCEHICQVDADVLFGYNSFGFDEMYIFTRCAVLDVEECFYTGRLLHQRCELKKTVLSSAAYGCSEFNICNLGGRVSWDVLQMVRREYKLHSYKLASVAEHFLEDECKGDVKYSELWTLQQGSSADRRRVAVYCVKDTELPMHLLDRLQFVPRYIEMSRVTRTFVGDLLTRGQQIKVFSQLLYKAMHEGYVMNKPQDGSQESATKFQGAFVLEPKRGAYYSPVSVLDFTSLYPSIEIAYNLSPETLVTDPAYGAVEGVDYVDVAVGGDGDGDGDGDGGPTYRFAQATRGREAGIVPRLLQQLLAARKATKREMKAHDEDSFLYQVLDAKQLALKVSCNSVYGFMGATRGSMPCMPVALSTTALGRQSLMKVKALAEQVTNAEGQRCVDVVYGDTDSIMCHYLHADADAEDAAVLAYADGISGRISAACNAVLPPPMSLELEATFLPIFFYKKKRYFGRDMVTNKLKLRGIEVVRRDNCTLMREALDAVIHKMAYERDPTAAKLCLEAYAQDLAAGDIPLEKLVITKSLSKPVHDLEGLARIVASTRPSGRAERLGRHDPELSRKALSRLSELADGIEEPEAMEALRRILTNRYAEINLPHVCVAHKMKLRDPFNCPRVGERVEYVVTAPQHEADRQQQFQRAEDPAHVRAKGLAVDVLYYLENQMRRPCVALLELVVETDDLFREVKRRATNRLNSNAEITSYFNKRGAVAAATTTARPAKAGRKAAAGGAPTFSTSTLDAFFRK